MGSTKLSAVRQQRRRNNSGKLRNIILLASVLGGTFISFWSFQGPIRSSTRFAGANLDSLTTLLDTVTPSTSSTQLTSSDAAGLTDQNADFEEEEEPIDPPELNDRQEDPKNSVTTPLSEELDFETEDSNSIAPTEKIINDVIQVETIEGDFVENGDPNSKTATVIGFAHGYSDLGTHTNFVGSLRATGYQGHILVFVKTDVPKNIIKYLSSQNVSTVKVEKVECTHGYNVTEMQSEHHLKTNLICLKPYSSIKMRWSKYPLSRDWLKACETCTGPVLISDYRDVFFQRDPFDGIKVEGLQVFEEYEIMTDHWLSQWPVKDCYGIDMAEAPRPMLCSGTTIGTRDAMIQYLDAMHKEFDHWVAHTQCHIKTDADDQSIHNYLVYYKSEVLPKPLYAVAYRTGIVNTIGVVASRLWRHDQEILQEKNKSGHLYLNVREDPWLDPDLGMTDDEGYLLQLDNSTRSRVLHQVDRFGHAFNRWMSKTLYDKLDW